jgi:hypothetical protein
VSATAVGLVAGDLGGAGASFVEPSIRGSLVVTQRAATAAVTGAVTQLGNCIKLNKLDVSNADGQLVIALTADIPYPDQPLSVVLKQLRADLTENVRHVLGPITRLDLRISSFSGNLPATKSSPRVQ